MIKGHHHISMITKDAVKNHQFYTQVLGLRLVKKTVNQDDSSMYHLFYGDRVGSVGTELSFFEIPMVGRTHRGTDAITKIGLFIPSEDSFEYWIERLAKHNIQTNGVEMYAGRKAVLFEDPEGLRFALFAHENEYLPEQWEAWEESIVPFEHRILGMGPTEITVQSTKLFGSMLEKIFDYSLVHTEGDYSFYQSVKGESFGEIIVKQELGAKERAGKGSIHHLAIRVENLEQLRMLDEKILEMGFQSSGIVDRYYFESIYFRDHNGILIELATDGKGFTVDSTVEELGKNLDLPPFLEEQRQAIEAKLKPLITE